MPRLPQHPNLDYLKKQARELLRLYQANEPAAFARFRDSLPFAAGKDDDSIVALELKLHDAQSCIAREYECSSWLELKNYVDWRNSKLSQTREDAVPRWLHYVYGHDEERPRPSLAAHMLEERPDLGQGDLFLACASDEAAVRLAIASDPSCVNRITTLWRCPGCKELLDMPPLIAVTHSTLLRLSEYRDRLRACARLLLDSGADPNQSTGGQHPLSALYGAAGKNHDPELTRMLLEAGASPNDGSGEVSGSASLYYSMETRDLTCAQLLLEAGAKVEGTNAIHHKLGMDDLEGLRLLLAYTKDPDDSIFGLGSPLLGAIRCRRSHTHVEALLEAGADPRARDNDGISAYRLAVQYGLADVADALEKAGAGEPLFPEDLFLGACARCDEQAARRILAERPDIFNTLSGAQLRLLPDCAADGYNDAVRLMVELGWPIAARGGGWDASALNHAVMRGDAELTRFLLEHGASWTEHHGHGDNVHGTLGWASRNNDPDAGDWVGCASALVNHGLPLDREGEYSEEVSEFLAAERAKVEGAR